jgi:hypothetical protein
MNPGNIVLHPHVLELPVLGITVTFTSSSPHVIAAIEGEYGHWRTLAETGGVISRSGAVVQIDLHGDGSALPTDLDFVYALSGDRRMEVEAPGAEGEADTSILRSFARVHRAYADRPDALVRGIVEPLTLFLLGALDRVPLHAGAVRRGDVGVVLAGPSGSGKSTLVYAAARAGYTPIADDPVYIQRHPALRVWGRRGTVHLRPQAREHFPELANVAETRLPGGKTKLVIDTHGTHFVEKVGLCLLRRGASAEPLLTRVSVARAREEVMGTLAPGFDLFRDSVGECVERVAARGAWLLEVGRSPDEAIRRIDEIVAAIEIGG